MEPRELELRVERKDDPETGRAVTRLFPDGPATAHPYFTSPSHDARGRLVVSLETGGGWQLACVDLQAGTAVQLTGPEDMSDLGPLAVAVCAANQTAYVRDGRSVKSVDLESGQVQNLFTAPEGYHVAIPSVDPHGRRLAFSIREESHEFTRTGKIYSVMHENYFHRPRSLVVAIDPEDGAPSVAWGEHEWISHVVVHPTEPNRIVFCHEGGLMVDHRLWVVDTDVLHKRTARPLYEEGPREFLVHEFFLPDGTLCVQHTVFAEDDAGRGDWSRAEERVMFLDDAGQVLDDYRLPGERDMHVQSTADRSLLVGDSWFPDPDTPHEQGSRYMALHRPDGDRLTVEKLCRHDTSWRTQTSHPHPVFGPDDQCVVFNSDAGGHSSACVCEV